MDNETFRSRVMNLVGRSRKALRLYSNIGRIQNDGSGYFPGSKGKSYSAHFNGAAKFSSRELRGNELRGSEFAGNEFTERQTDEWKNITADLLKELSAALENCKNLCDLADAIFSLRDKFNGQWRTVESEIHPKQKELTYASESGDYVKAAMLSSELVLLKARMQAAQAAHHELEDVIKKTRFAQPPIELSTDNVIEDREVPLFSAKVIPIRKLL